MLTARDERTLFVNLLSFAGAAALTLVLPAAASRPVHTAV